MNEQKACLLNGWVHHLELLLSSWKG